MKNLLIIYHSQSGNTEQLAREVLAGCRQEADIQSRLLGAFDADLDDLRWADGLLFGTPENFGTMSGALKDFFDRTYNGALGKTDGLPYAVYIRAGMDGTGTKRSIKSITTGLRWREVQPPLILKGDWRAEFLSEANDLGMSLSAGLEAGVF